ncbi:MAG: hypothetical protein I3273_01510 [Candidatus Moeniiplasma glomeromycotorum]|nr:hypothetical protein [Candidatus Moeniiplasma glomeromycotorum]MCE8167201.1 hypothetical protein [Candidatus Moeniiplasma glomeromycotorum]MCE8168787.1 hypothetical protein [Candidatus Moeniiplasma glomeromycotorum]
MTIRVKTFSIEVSDRLFDNSMKASLLEELRKKARHYYGEGFWEISDVSDFKKGDGKTIISMGTEGRRQFLKEIGGGKKEPLFFCDHCEEPEWEKEKLVEMHIKQEGIDPRKLSKIRKDCLQNVWNADVKCPRTGSDGWDDWTRPRYDCYCVYSPEFKEQKLWK